MHTALHQAHLLCNIVRHLEFTERFYCALVCRTWHDILTTFCKCWRFDDIDDLINDQLKRFVTLNSKFKNVEDINNFVQYIYIAGQINDTHWRPILNACLTLTCKVNDLTWRELFIRCNEDRYWVNVLELPPSRQRSNYFLLVTKKNLRSPNDDQTDWDDIVIYDYHNWRSIRHQQVPYFANCVRTCMQSYDLIAFPTPRSVNAVKKRFLSRDVTGLRKKDYCRLVQYANKAEQLYGWK